jgi:hypothetical protein
MVPTYRFYVRRFLNRRGHYAGAYVLASVRDTSRERGSYVEPDVEFTLADCNRVVSLDFPLSSESSRRNSLAKAAVLADVTARFKEALEAEAEAVARREAERERSKDQPPPAAADWMVRVWTGSGLGDMSEADQERVMDSMMESLADHSAVVGYGRGGLSVTLTVWAHCYRDAPAMGKAIVRGAMRDAGVMFDGRLQANVER